jgi:hypothetical protein
MLSIKKILFPSSFCGIFDFFVFFNNFGKRMLRYKGGMSVENIQVQCPGTRLMFKVRTLGKNPPGAKGFKTQSQSATGLVYRHALYGSVESNMEPTLGQICRYAISMNKTHNGNILRCEFNEPREGKFISFSYLESLENIKGDSTGVPFLKVV